MLSRRIILCFLTLTVGTLARAPTGSRGVDRLVNDDLVSFNCVHGFPSIPMPPVTPYSLSTPKFVTGSASDEAARYGIV
jgi:hypothetical protein